MREAWGLLKASHPELVEDVADGNRFVWLGSGISRDQVPDLVELIDRVLRFLRDRASSSETDAIDHRNALIEILDEYLPGELASYEADPKNWRPITIDGLREHYSAVLGVGVPGKPNDYLLIDGADLPELYGSSDLQPGPTHKILAMLISEGVITNLASGNWDGLVEKAIEDISSASSLLNVYVDVNDPRDAAGQAEIAKFHGCAVLTLADSGKYRDKIIATTAQITKLHGDDAYAHMRDHLRDLTTRMRSLVLGLSVQDSDLLAIFRASTSRSPWSWDSAHPAYLFAEPAVKSSQKVVLEVAYGEDYGRERLVVLERSALGAFAGPVTAALLIEVLKLKLVTVLRRHIYLSDQVLTTLEQGINRLILRIVLAFGHNEETLVNFLLSGYSDFLRTYFGPTIVGDAQYLPFARGTRNQLESDFVVVATHVDRLAVAVGLLGTGEQKGRWRVSLKREDQGSRIVITRRHASSSVIVIVVRGAAEAISVMESHDWNDDRDDMILLQMDVGYTASPRSPAGRIGRRRRTSVRRQLAWHEISDSVTDAEELLGRFETGALL